MSTLVATRLAQIAVAHELAVPIERLAYPHNGLVLLVTLARRDRGDADLNLFGWACYDPLSVVSALVTKHTDLLLGLSAVVFSLCHPAIAVERVFHWAVVAAFDSDATPRNAHVLVAFDEAHVVMRRKLRSTPVIVLILDDRLVSTVDQHASTDRKLGQRQRMFEREWSAIELFLFSL
jgi:hypothetical protein